MNRSGKHKQQRDAIIAAPVFNCCSLFVHLLK